MHAWLLLPALFFALLTGRPFPVLAQGDAQNHVGLRGSTERAEPENADVAREADLDAAAEAEAIREAESDAAFVSEASHDAEQRVVEISDSPRIYQVDDYFSDEECDFLKQHGLPHLQQSLTIDRTNGSTVVDKVRTNMQMYVSKEDSVQHPFIRRIVRRLYRLARIPLGHGEQVQIGRYRVGEKYDCHYDSEVRVGVLRAATVIVYISEAESGGDTVFPMGEDCHELGTCCDATSRGQLKRVHPKKGRALLFYSHDLDGSLNTNTLHCSCPVVQGEKWIMQAWFRVSLYTDSPHYPMEGRTSSSSSMDEADANEL